jgi:hypothetical protein
MQERTARELHRFLPASSRDARSDARDILMMMRQRPPMAFLLPVLIIGTSARPAEQHTLS